MLAGLPPSHSSNGDYRFPLWELIFGRPSVGRSTPPWMAISDSCSDSPYFMPTLRTDIWQIWCWQIYPPIKWQFHRFLLWQFIFHSHSWVLIFGRPGWADLPLPLHQTATIDSYSESSYLADQVLADLPPSNGNFTGSCSDSSYFISTLRAHIWQTSCGQIYPPIKWWFHRLLLWHLIFHSFSEGSYLADQVLADLLPASNSNYRFLFWELIFGRPNVGRSTPVLMAISHIAVLTAHIRFLFWELIFGRPSVGRSNPPHQTATIDSYTEGSYLAGQLWADLSPPLHQTATIASYSESSYLADQLSDLSPAWNGNYRFSTLRAHIWQTKCWQIYPPWMAVSQFLLWQLIFHSYSESSYLADQLWADLPPSNGDFINCSSELIDSCSESSYLADQVLADLTPSLESIRFLFWQSILDSTLRTDIWQIWCWQIYPPIKWQFHRFLLWQFIFHSHSWVLIFGRPGWADLPLPLHQTATIDSYSESSYLADQVLADLPPSNGNFTGSCSDSSYFILLWELIFGRPVVGRSTPPIKWWFHILLLWHLIFHSFTLRLIFGSTRCWQSTPCIK